MTLLPQPFGVPCTIYANQVPDSTTYYTKYTILKVRCERSGMLFFRKQTPHSHAELLKLKHKHVDYKTNLFEEKTKNPEISTKKNLPSNFLHLPLVMCLLFLHFFCHQQQKNISAWGQMGFRCHPSPLTTPSSNAWSPPCRSAWNEARFDGPWMGYFKGEWNKLRGWAFLGRKN